MGKFGLLLAVSAVLAPSSLLAGAVPHESYYPPATVPSVSKKFTDKLGAVACEAEECSTIGIDILRKGGSAADAIVGTVFCVGTIGMYHSGIGGGGFTLVHKGSKKGKKSSYEFIDFREEAPAAATEDMYTEDSDLSLYGGQASGIPGELRGLEHLHKNYGRLPWSTLVKPAIDIARYGFPVNADLDKFMKTTYTTYQNESFLLTDPTWAIDFAPKGKLLTLGDKITRKRYAKTLEAIAKGGADAFYEGHIARATIKALKEQDGIMTMADLKNYSVVVREPNQISYKGGKITGGTAPSSGAVGLAVMKILEGYEGIGDATQVNKSTHLLDEALKFSYGMRTNLGDPSFVDGMTEYQKQMVSEETAEAVRAKITDRALNLSAYDPAGLESLETPGTSHIVVMDKSGLAISLTTTINLIFGSRLMVPETGVIMNNEMNDFSIPGSSNAFGYIPSEANYIRPGKRPLSSISTTIVERANGIVSLVTGSAGGSRIITATLQVLLNVLEKNMTAPEALAEPRLHDQMVPQRVEFEYTYDNSTVAYMKEIGNNVTWVALGRSTAQALRLLENGTFEAAGEPRQFNSGGYAT
ncbi:hypothetical protein G7Z17_g5165 [Cylindrodendrum hubeiense]|uniref:Glutathione hydrolase n=1 Tax=Cylindrodendrum hubeiense TaxID=595255 RepID=A0A9P5HER0_9HYPO|nr:hypothetical protein G7Z17_g5165 [Cylindrodendrum hubeiense]